ncbi:MAG: HNH endonuclease, partial [Krumholzibacteria bacterium]|nr:HNH endonuclease [Candidatus Krumholzibacteria bacterium]
AAGDRAEVLLEALQCLFVTTSCSDAIPRGKPDPGIHIHVHQCPDCGQVEANGRALGRADAERVQCDAVVSAPGKRATTTIPPRTRREVLARDRHRCQGPGCGRTRFLEIHHKWPRARGGTHEPANLVTLCAACHRLWHERR